MHIQKLKAYALRWSIKRALTQKRFAKRSPGRTCGSFETKTPEQQSGLMLHRTRQRIIRQQTAVINAIRAHLGEFGIVAPVGRMMAPRLVQ